MLNYAICAKLMSAIETEKIIF